MEPHGDHGDGGGQLRLLRDLCRFRHGGAVHAVLARRRAARRRPALAARVLGGSTAVDVNTIPVEWVERVEVITGGASAVYGADAVAGVVNFILKKNFTGFETRAQTGLANEGNYNRSFASFSAGTDFAEGRGNIAVSGECHYQGDPPYRPTQYFCDTRACYEL
ncbi:TonB-dependent receptor plug domain-containing protein [Dickeya chrysanthemi]|nr:TonB-dependent receptor plug domain-containing protein [Dickeya chrysanthemi]WJM85519.1 TonB-dependent receptor plug domain-containing protein [Dickeya chrysanthemi]